MVLNRWVFAIFLEFFSSIFCIILVSLPRNLDWNIEIISNIFLKQSNTYIDILGKSLGEFFFLFSTNIYFSVVLGEIIVLERYALLVLKTRGRKRKRKKFKIKNQNSNWVKTKKKCILVDKKSRVKKCFWKTFKNKTVFFLPYLLFRNLLLHDQFVIPRSKTTYGFKMINFRKVWKFIPAFIVWCSYSCFPVNFPLNKAIHNMIYNPRWQKSITKSDWLRSVQ